MSSAAPYAIMLVVCASVATTWYGLRADLPSRLKLKASVPAVQVSSEDYTRRQPGRPLFAGLDSYASLDQVRRQFAAKKFEPEYRLLSRPPDPRYPVHALETLSLQQYPLLGTEGRLSLQFFNDRLLKSPTNPTTQRLVPRR